MAEEYNYFVSYHYQCATELNGVGNVFIKVSTAINKRQDIIDIANLIEKEQNFSKVVIMNFQLLSTTKIE
jgi:hypothetical protein